MIHCPINYSGSHGVIAIKRKASYCYNYYINCPTVVRLNFPVLSGYEESTIALTDISGNLLPRWIENYDKNTPDGTLWYNDAGNPTDGGTTVYLQYGCDTSIPNDGDAFGAFTSLALLGNSGIDSSSNEVPLFLADISYETSNVLGGNQYVFNGNTSILMAQAATATMYSGEDFVFLVWANPEGSGIHPFISEGNRDYEFGITDTGVISHRIYDSDNGGWGLRSYSGITGNEGMNLWSAIYSHYDAPVGWENRVEIYKNADRIDDTSDSSGTFSAPVGDFSTADHVYFGENPNLNTNLSGSIKCAIMMRTLYGESDIQRFYINTSGWTTNYTLDYSYIKRLRLLKSSGVSNSDCPIAAIDSKGFSPNKIINVESKEDSIYENTEEFNYIETLNKNDNVYASSDYYIEDDNYDVYASTSGNHFEFNHYNIYSTSKYQKFLVTNYYSDFQNGVPLFYQYEPLYNISSNVSGIVNFTIYKNDNIIVNSNQYITQFSYDLLNNENSRYDSTIWGNITNTNIHRARFLLPLYFSDKDTYYTLEYTKNISGVSEYQKELIELRDVYTSGDFNIVEIKDYAANNYQCGGLMISSSGSIPSGVTTLSVVKDPYTKVRPLDIINMDDSSNPSWNLRFSYGSLYIPQRYDSDVGDRMYYPRSNNSAYYSGIHPDFVTSSLINVNSALDLSGYSYPNYSVPTGNFNIKVNGITRNDIKITSIDSKKGYIQLNKSLDKTDDITTTFKVANGDWWPVDLELNPTKSGSIFNTYPNGFGLAIEPITSGLMIYDHNSDPSFFDEKPICYVTLNHLSPEFIKLTDARRTAGLYDRTHLKNWFYNKYGYYHRDFDWYSDIARYDGLVLSRGGTIIINIPNDKLEAERTKWINHYKTIMDNDSAEIKANEEFNFYLDQVIRRNISAGSDYIIVPTISGEITGAIWNG